MPGWLAAFKAIPWGELIAAAPVVVRGTQRLLETVRRQTASDSSAQDPASRLRSLEAQVTELRGELTAASGLIANLAEQNSHLIDAVAVLRVRARALFVISIGMAAVLAWLLVHALR